MTLCTFTDGRCRRCGTVRQPPYPRRNCRPGLGDRVASGLATVGITKERVAALLGDCGCQQRQQWLNEFGRRFGMGGETADKAGDEPTTTAT